MSCNIHCQFKSSSRIALVQIILFKMYILLIISNLKYVLLICLPRSISVKLSDSLARRTSNSESEKSSLSWDVMCSTLTLVTVANYKVKKQ